MNTLQLYPDRLFPDRAFRQAEDTGRTLRRISMNSSHLALLQERLRAAGMTRATGFRKLPPQTGTVPRDAALYRDVPIALVPELEASFLAEYHDGTLDLIPV